MDELCPPGIGNGFNDKPENNLSSGLIYYEMIKFNGILKMYDWYKKSDNSIAGAGYAGAQGTS
jgi:hypothetical protein